jgi:uncharacterized protein (DUF111 family)
VGGGRVQSAHGWLPVPAPATVRLLEGLPVLDDGIEGERVTPTGAAILKSLAPQAARPQAGVLKAGGIGFGTRSLPGLPNCLQILCIQVGSRPQLAAAGFHPELDQVAMLRFEVDDQTPEDFALAMDRLRATRGVLSLTSFQGIGKNGRPTLSVEVLARPGELSAVAEACFRETTTIGLRWQQIARFVLSRRAQRLQLADGPLEVKLVQRPDGTGAKAEVRDLAGQAGHAERQQRRRLGEQTALGGDPDREPD